MSRYSRCVGVFDAALQFLVRHRLEFGVDRQADVVSTLGGDVSAGGDPHRAGRSVSHVGDGTGSGLEGFVKEELRAEEALVVDADETEE